MQPATHFTVGEERQTGYGTCRGDDDKTSQES